MSIQVKKHVPSGTIILKRPEKRNAISRQMIVDLMQALDDFHQEKHVRAIIITGAGDAFSAGADLSEIDLSRNEPDVMMQWHDDAIAYRDLLERMLLFPKPIIAAINGPALASGAGIAMAADITVASEKATFGFPEARRGLVAGVVAPLLVFKIGASHASRLLLTGLPVDAHVAHQMGAFQEVVDSGLVWARAQELSLEVAKCAPESIQLTKRMLTETIGEHLGGLLSVGAAATATARTTEAAQEGIAAFLAKREPKWP